jgi:hypothetical protein
VPITDLLSIQKGKTLTNTRTICVSVSSMRLKLLGREVEQQLEQLPVSCWELHLGKPLVVATTGGLRHASQVLLALLEAQLMAKLISAILFELALATEATQYFSKSARRKRINRTVTVVTALSVLRWRRPSAY